jgi:hypothetical protein
MVTIFDRRRVPLQFSLANNSLSPSKQNIIAHDMLSWAMDPLMEKVGFVYCKNACFFKGPLGGRCIHVIRGEYNTVSWK